MKEVTLQFDLLIMLNDFTLLIDIRDCLIDEASFRLTCVLQELELAKKDLMQMF